MGEGEKGKRIIPKWGIKKEFRKFLNERRRLKKKRKKKKEKKNLPNLAIIPRSMENKGARNGGLVQYAPYLRFMVY